MKPGSLAAALAIAVATLLSAVPAKAQVGDCGSSVVVAFGESLRDIARRCSTTVDAIMQVNPLLPSAYFVLPGMRVQMPAPPPTTNVVRYTVQRGDTLLSIARAYGITLGDIFRLNPDIDAATLRTGDVIRLPGGIVPPPPPADATVRYVVRAGDTLRSIARANDVALSEIRRLNPGVQSQDLRVGDVLRLPAAAPRPPVNILSYTVRRGDTLYSIARANGMTVTQLLELNPGLDPTRVRVGDVILLRSGVVPPPPPPPVGIAASVSPTSGPPGTVAQVSASGFQPSVPLKLFAGSKIATLQEFQQVTTDSRGGAVVSVRIPEWAAGPGTLVFAFETLDGRLRAVSGVFTVASSPPPPAAGVRVVGTLTREGVECQAMRGDDGKLYTLVGRNLGDFLPGDRVRVDGNIAAVSICMQGTTIAVTRIASAPE